MDTIGEEHLRTKVKEYRELLEEALTIITSPVCDTLGGKNPEMRDRLVKFAETLEKEKIGDTRLLSWVGRR